MPKRFIISVILFSFITTMVTPRTSFAQGVQDLPAPGTMVNLSRQYMPMLMKGLVINPQNPFQFDFLMDTGNEFTDSKKDYTDVRMKGEGSRLIKYFLAALTIPEEDLWVNLSPYEKDRMIPSNLRETEMGRDMLAQDYLLKQLTASLIYPEKDLGREFWNKVYAKAQALYGTTEIPVSTFNKVWIVANQADVFERGNAAYVVGAHLKVMLEEDYEALNRQTKGVGQTPGTRDGFKSSELGSQIIRELIIPALETEINEGQNFAPLRQMFHSMILASWFKMALKDSIMTQLYGNQGKVKGLGIDVVGGIIKRPYTPQEIYQQYLKAYKKGVYNYIKEDASTPLSTSPSIPRKYFSGGAAVWEQLKEGPRRLTDFAQISDQATAATGQILQVEANIVQTPTHNEVDREIIQQILSKFRGPYQRLSLEKVAIKLGKRSFNYSFITRRETGDNLAGYLRSLEANLFNLGSEVLFLNEIAQMNNPVAHLFSDKATGRNYVLVVPDAAMVIPDDAWDHFKVLDEDPAVLENGYTNLLLTSRKSRRTLRQGTHETFFELFKEDEGFILVTNVNPINGSGIGFAPARPRNILIGKDQVRAIKIFNAAKKFFNDMEEEGLDSFMEQTVKDMTEQMFQVIKWSSLRIGQKLDEQQSSFLGSVNTSSSESLGAFRSERLQRGNAQWTVLLGDYDNKVSLEEYYFGPGEDGEGLADLFIGELKTKVLNRKTFQEIVQSVIDSLPIDAAMTNDLTPITISNNFLEWITSDVELHFETFIKRFNRDDRNAGDVFEFFSTEIAGPWVESLMGMHYGGIPDIMGELHVNTDNIIEEFVLWMSVFLTGSEMEKKELIEYINDHPDVDDLLQQASWAFEKIILYLSEHENETVSFGDIVKELTPANAKVSFEEVVRVSSHALHTLRHFKAIDFKDAAMMNTLEGMQNGIRESLPRIQDAFRRGESNKALLEQIGRHPNSEDIPRVMRARVGSEYVTLTRVPDPDYVQAKRDQVEPYLRVLSEYIDFPFHSIEKIKTLQGMFVLFMDANTGQEFSKSEVIKGKAGITAIEGLSIYRGKILILLFHGQLSENAAMTTTISKSPGGIDLNRKNLKMNISKEGAGVEISAKSGIVTGGKFDPAMIEKIKKQGFDGFVPVILNITPIKSVLPILGLSFTPKEEQLAKI